MRGASLLARMRARQRRARCRTDRVIVFAAECSSSSNGAGNGTRVSGTHTPQ